MKTNYYAFALAIAKGCLPEPAFAHIESTPYIAADYAEDMKILKGLGLTWGIIGELFGVTEHAAFRAVKRNC